MTEIALRYEWTDALLKEAMAVAADPGRGDSHSRWVRELRDFLIFLAFILAVLFVNRRMQIASHREFFAFCLGLLVMLAIWALTSLRRSRAFLSRALVVAGARGLVDLRLGSEGVAVQTAQGGSNFLWSAVTRIAEGRHGLFIVVGASQAMPLPDAALPDGISRTDLRDRVEGWRELAKPQGIAP